MLLLLINSIMDDLEKLKALAGVYTNPGAKESLGYGISLSASEKAQIMRERNIKAGTPEWFRLWFAQTNLTGERPID
jgi:hypothetical protein